MSYAHPGNAWTDVESGATRLVYCDLCAEVLRRGLRQFDDDGEMGMQVLSRLVSPRTQVGYYDPEPYDRCHRCGVVAEDQHKEDG